MNLPSQVQTPVLEKIASDKFPRLPDASKFQNLSLDEQEAVLNRFHAFLPCEWLSQALPEGQEYTVQGSVLVIKRWQVLLNHQWLSLQPWATLEIYPQTYFMRNNGETKDDEGNHLYAQNDTYKICGTGDNPTEVVNIVSWQRTTNNLLCEFSDCRITPHGHTLQIPYIQNEKSKEFYLDGEKIIVSPHIKKIDNKSIFIESDINGEKIYIEYTLNNGRQETVMIQIWWSPESQKNIHEERLKRYKKKIRYLIEKKDARIKELESISQQENQ